MRRFLAALALSAFALSAAAPASADADLSITEHLPKPQAGGVPWSARDVATLRKNLNELLAGSALAHAHVGLVVRDTVRGTVLYSRNGNDAFQPASNFKLLVGSAALERLGTLFAFHTEVLADGTVANGTLNGNLYLKGGGDIHLMPADLAAAAAAVAAAGITHVTGSVIGDATRYDDQRYGYGWDWDDLPYYYAPVVTALGLDEYVYHVRMIPGAKLGAPITLDASNPSSVVTIDNRLTTGTRDTSDIVRPWDEPNTIRLTGTYALGAKESGDLAPALPDPAAYAVDIFAQYLTAHGVRVDGPEMAHGGPAPPTAVVLWKHASEPMPQLLADFWWPSDNLQGEIFLKELSVAYGAKIGNDRDGARDEETWLRSIGVDPSSVTISDGSGLSDYDRVTPDDLVAILQHDWNGPYRDVVLDALPVAGVVGTLRNAYKETPAVKNVWAKTGSINHVRTMSGFLRTRRHGAVTFSFLVNGWMGEGTPQGPAALAILRGAVLTNIITN